MRRVRNICVLDGGYCRASECPRICDGKGAGDGMLVLMCTLLCLSVILCSAMWLKDAFSEERAASSVESVVKQINQIEPPETIRAAIERGAKVVDGDGKKTLVNVDGRVFAYDKFSGRLIQTKENPS